MGKKRCTTSTIWYLEPLNGATLRVLEGEGVLDREDLICSDGKSHPLFRCRGWHDVRFALDSEVEEHLDFKVWKQLDESRPQPFRPRKVFSGRRSKKSRSVRKSSLQRELFPASGLARRV